MFSYREVVGWERQRIRNAFAEASRDRVLVIQRELEHCIAAVHDIASLFEASTEVRRREYYEKPTSMRKRKAAAAVKRHLKKLQRENRRFERSY